MINLVHTRGGQKNLNRRRTQAYPEGEKEEEEEGDPSPRIDLQALEAPLGTR